MGIERDPLAVPVLVGRDQELTFLRDAVDSAAAGFGGVVFLEGEAGIGKTSLIRAALGVPRIAFLGANAEQMDSHRPFGVLFDAFGVDAATAEPGRANVATLLNAERIDSSPGTPQGVAFRVAEALLDLVDEVCSAGPTVLVLEDLHWADPPSLIVLHRLVGRIAKLPMLAILSARSLPRHQELSQLISAALATEGGTRLHLSPLPQACWAAMVKCVVGSQPGPELLRQLAGAAGNPLFITEMLRALARDVDVGASPVGASSAPTRPTPGPPFGSFVDLPTVFGDTSDCTPAARSPSLAVTILRHLSFLSAPTRDLLGLASVLGSHFSVLELARLAESSVVSLRASLTEALGAGVLGEDGDRLAFRHELIRDALYQDLPRALRRGLHSDAAAMLVASGAPPARVAEHLLCAGTNDVETVGWLHRAATEAASGGPRIAVELWERALALAASDNPLRVDMQVGMALALTDAGRPGEAEALCRRILSGGARPESEGQLRFFLSRSLMLRGQISEAQETARWDGADPVDRARLKGSLAALSAFGGDLDAAQVAAREADDQAAAAGDAAGRVIALSAFGFVQGCRGELSGALTNLAEAASLRDSDGSRAAVEAAPHAHLALVLIDLDRVEEARAMLVRAGDPGGSLTQLWKVQIIGLAVMMQAGDFDDAAAEIEAMTTLAEETGVGWQGLVHASRARIALYRQGPDEAEAWLQKMDAAPGPTAPAIGTSWPTRARAAQLAAQGEPEAAAELAWTAWDSLRAAGFRRECRMLGFDLVSLAAQLAQAWRAGAVAAELESLAALNPEVASLEGAARRARGLVAGDADLLLASVSSYRRSPCRYELARALEDAATVLARAKRRPEAEQAGAQALALYSELGLAWEASRARSALREVGLRPGPRGSHQRPTLGWASLTPTETKIVAMVADGLSNPEMAARLFLSRRTIESHVSHVLCKLGLRSRTELAVASVRRPPT